MSYLKHGGEWSEEAKQRYAEARRQHKSVYDLFGDVINKVKNKIVKIIKVNNGQQKKVDDKKQQSSGHDSSKEQIERVKAMIRERALSAGPRQPQEEKKKGRKSSGKKTSSGSSGSGKKSSGSSSGKKSSGSSSSSSKTQEQKRLEREQEQKRKQQERDALKAQQNQIKMAKERYALEQKQKAEKEKIIDAKRLQDKRQGRYKIGDDDYYEKWYNNNYKVKHVDRENVYIPGKTGYSERFL